MPSTPITGNLEVEFDATASLAGLSDGDPISTWADTSGNARNATQTLTLRPTKQTVSGHPVARFDGSNDYLPFGNAFSLGDNVTVFVVWSTTVQTTRQTLLGQENAAGAMAIELGGVASGFGPRPQIGAIVTGTNIAGGSDLYNWAGVPQVTCYRRAGSGAGTHTVRTNGHAIGLAVDSATNFTGNGTKGMGRRASGSQFFNGDIACLLIYSTNLSDSDVQTVENYLISRYSIDAARGTQYSFTVLNEGTATNLTSGQGVAYDGAGNYFGVGSTELRKYTRSGTTYTQTASRTISGDLSGETQFNGGTYHNGYIWLGASNFSTTPKLSWVSQFDPATLTVVANNSTRACWGEGGAWNDVGDANGDCFWMVCTEDNLISQYDSAFAHIADYTLEFADTTDTNNLYQGGAWLGNLFFTCTHNSGPCPQIHIYEWNGTGFTGIQRMNQLNSDQGQGLSWEAEGSIMVFYDRGDNTFIRATFSGLATGNRRRRSIICGAA